LISVSVIRESDTTSPLARASTASSANRRISLDLLPSLGKLDGHAWGRYSQTQESNQPNELSIFNVPPQLHDPLAIHPFSNWKFEYPKPHTARSPSITTKKTHPSHLLPLLAFSLLSFLSLFSSLSLFLSSSSLSLSSLLYSLLSPNPQTLFFILNFNFIFIFSFPPQLSPPIASFSPLFHLLNHLILSLILAILILSSCIFSPTSPSRKDSPSNRQTTRTPVAKNAHTPPPCLGRFNADRNALGCAVGCYGC